MRHLTRLLLLGVAGWFLPVAVGCNDETGKEVTTQSGLKYIDVKIGTGDEAVKGDVVRVHYTGWLKDGTKFDSNLDRNEPLDFRIGDREVIAGWEEGVAGMHTGGKRKLIIPPGLAYGDQKKGTIPPNSELTFEVELLRVKKVPR